MGCCCCCCNDGDVSDTESVQSRYRVRRGSEAEEEEITLAMNELQPLEVKDARRKQHSRKPWSPQRICPGIKSSRPYEPIPNSHSIMIECGAYEGPGRQALLEEEALAREQLRAALLKGIFDIVANVRKPLEDIDMSHNIGALENEELDLEELFGRPCIPETDTSSVDLDLAGKKYSVLKALRVHIEEPALDDYEDANFTPRFSAPNSTSASPSRRTTNAENSMDKSTKDSASKSATLEDTTPKDKSRSFSKATVSPVQSSIAFSPSAYATPNRSREPSNMSPSKYQFLLEAKPFLKLDIDEVGDRDEITRDAMVAIARMHMDCYHAGLVHMMRYDIYPLYVIKHIGWLLAACEWEEFLGRADIEKQALLAWSLVKMEVSKMAAKRSEWERQREAMEKRRAAREEKKRANREEKKMMDKLHWQSEQERLRRERGALADEEFTTELHAAVAAALPIAAHMGRQTREALVERARLGVEEQRHRMAIIDEEGKRWVLLHNSCAELCPWIVNHPERSLFLDRKKAELAALEMEERRQLNRIALSVPALPERERIENKELLAGQATALLYDHGEQAHQTATSEEAQRQELETVIENAMEALGMQTRRARLRAAELEREANEQAVEEAARMLVKRVGRGYIWRRRLCPIIGIAPEVASLVRAEEIARKHLKRAEHIFAGDIYNYYVLQARLRWGADSEAFLRLYPRPECATMSWDPTATDPVEKLHRGAIEKEFYDSFEECITKPAAAERAAIAALPPHMVGTRLRATKIIQRNWRNFIGRQRFVRGPKDTLTLAYYSRVRRRAALRLLIEQETLNRSRLEAERPIPTWDDFWAFVAEREQQRVAATRIQAVYRSYRLRAHLLDPDLLSLLMKKLRYLYARRNLRPPIEGIERMPSGVL